MIRKPFDEFKMAPLCCASHGIVAVLIYLMNRAVMIEKPFDEFKMTTIRCE